MNNNVRFCSRRGGPIGSSTKHAVFVRELFKIIDSSTKTPQFVLEMLKTVQRRGENGATQKKFFVSLWLSGQYAVWRDLVFCKCVSHYFADIMEKRTDYQEPVSEVIEVLTENVMQNISNYDSNRENYGDGDSDSWSNF